MENKKGRVKFGRLLDKSFDDYKLNFKSIFKLIILLVGIPYLLFTILQLVFIATDPNVFSFVSNSQLANQVDLEGLEVPLYYSITNTTFSLVYLFLGVLISAGLLGTSLKKSKYSLKEIIEEGKSKYWRFFGFSIVIFIFILLLSLLLVIPGIIFGIYWIFAACIFLERKESIRGSLKKSKEMVKGRWWRTFGIYVLFGLVMIGIIIVVSIINIPRAIFFTMSAINGTPLSMWMVMINTILNLVYEMVVSLIGVPLSVLFMKNFYLEMKGKKE
jgi:hypothetical protein